MHPPRIRFAALLALLSFVPLARAEDIDLSTLQPTDDLTPQKQNDGLHITGDGMLLTPKKYTTPFTVRASAMTDGKSLRLYFAKGELILDWENNTKELRFHDPRDGSQHGVPNQGSTAKNRWVTIIWTFDDKQSTVTVNGQSRASFPGDFSQLTGQIGFGTYGKDANVVLRSMNITPGAAKTTPAANTNSKPHSSSSEYIDVPVTTGPHVDNPPAPPATADPDDIERPQFQTTAKPLLKNLTSITSMMVNIEDDGTEHGLTNDIIATVPAQSRQENSSGIGFISNDGDETMKVGLQEAVRAVTLRYPIWEHGHIDLSFSEKFVAHGGPSAATAFGVLMLSTLEGFSIDPKCAITGDLTVDWKVRKIGGVTAKLHGATLDHCLYAAIPEENASALPDLALLYGPSALSDIQIFSIATLQDAVAITRKDRDPQLAQAIKEFANLQPTLAADKSALKSLSTQTALKHILTLAPNHISAKYLLAINQGTAPKVLSDAAIEHQVDVLLYPYASILFSKFESGTTYTVPLGLSNISRKRVEELRPLVSKDFAPVLIQLSAFVETADSVANHHSPIENLKTRVDSLFATMVTATHNTDFAENLRREGF